ncbi:MAG TPA: hypothetical protein DEF85_05460 [Clostridiaceae bacterium]|nr:hypothetical protein [Clostridiaceae bacterium]HBF76687.1 hypothetical protein [Clostridiaceae bacterium]HBG39741.1 hypothetical protein [Clostridiaceae bacterium]HBN28638.1 hypothetical protein [Clostridiaceae bacterium]HBX48320.1 hypothetical protein [Clostridiaceae bacterium]
MYMCYCDLNHDAIINQMNHYDDVYGVEKLKRIFFDVKNSIYYDTFTSMQRASETLVMGRGNNIDKNILLYTLLKLGEFDCHIKCALVTDNTKRLISRSNKEISWYYVEVSYFGRAIILDASFDSGFMRAAGIECKGNDKDYDFSCYCTNDGRKLFNVRKRLVENKEEELDLNGYIPSRVAM